MYFVQHNLIRTMTKKNNPIFSTIFVFFENKRKNENIISISKAETVWNYTITLRIRKKKLNYKNQFFRKIFYFIFYMFYKIQMF